MDSGAMAPLFIPFFRTDKALNCMSSDWPVTQLLRELRLKMLRQIVYEMEFRGVWIARKHGGRVIQARKQFGLSILNELLFPSLGEDLSLLHGEDLFGVNDYQFATKASLSLVFGYDYGGGMHDIIAPSGTKRNQIVGI